MWNPWWDTFVSEGMMLPLHMDLGFPISHVAWQTLLQWVEGSQTQLQWVEGSQTLLQWVEGSQTLLQWVEGSQTLLQWVEGSQTLLQKVQLIKPHQFLCM